MRITVFDWAPAATPGAVKVYVALHVPPLDEQLLIPPETALPPLTETDPNEDGVTVRSNWFEATAWLEVTGEKMETNRIKTKTWESILDAL